jgi:DNA helicase-2/ATP-dependent DNA helicase PcrA
MKGEGAQSIAVLCKTAKHCYQLQQLLMESVQDTFPVVSNFSDSSRPQASIMPSYVAKGLEFDSVIVADADAETFSQLEYDSKLLYLSLTRALHDLHIYWVGDIAHALRSVVGG